MQSTPISAVFIGLFLDICIFFPTTTFEILPLSPLSAFFEAFAMPLLLVRDLEGAAAKATLYKNKSRGYISLLLHNTSQYSHIPDNIHVSTCIQYTTS